LTETTLTNKRENQKLSGNEANCKEQDTQKELLSKEALKGMSV
jgi:hypothetical protein